MLTRPSPKTIRITKLCTLLLIGFATLSALPHTHADDNVEPVYTFSGIVTIDGDPAPIGTTIRIQTSDRIVGTHIVSEPGIWSIQVDGSLLKQGACEATLLVNSKKVDRQWNWCSPEVLLEISNAQENPPALDAPKQPDDPKDPNPHPDKSTQPQPPNQPSPTTNHPTPSANPEPTTTTSHSQPPPTATDAPATYLRPNIPKTGTGGVQLDDGSVNLLRVGSLLAYLALILALAALLLFSRSARFGKPSHP